jgi:hypothetical protein
MKINNYQEREIRKMRNENFLEKTSRGDAEERIAAYELRA